jgi:hypothetical protein
MASCRKITLGVIQQSSNRRDYHYSLTCTSNLGESLEREARVAACMTARKFDERSNQCITTTIKVIVRHSKACRRARTAAAANLSTFTKTARTRSFPLVPGAGKRRKTVPKWKGISGTP